MTIRLPALDLDALDFAKGGGCVTVVTQDATTGVVLMVAQADRGALERTMDTGEMHYTSRRRGLWHKGATSGHVQRVVTLAADCDGDAVLARVVPAGPACHTGSQSCFGAEPVSDAVSVLDHTIDMRSNHARRCADGASPSYTQRLLGDRNLRLKKIGEEAAEFVVACADVDPACATSEAADIVFHLLVALRAAGANWQAIQHILATRADERSSS